jgi:hypothetical protein
MLQLELLLFLLFLLLEVELGAVAQGLFIALVKECIIKSQVLVVEVED